VALLFSPFSLGLNLNADTCVTESWLRARTSAFSDDRHASIPPCTVHYMHYRHSVVDPIITPPTINNNVQDEATSCSSSRCSQVSYMSHHLDIRQLTTRMCNFITASPTPFQAVHNLSARLLSSSFTKLSEKTSFTSLKAGGKYFYTRNQSSLVAFTLPSQPTPKTAISFAVGHLDSPCLKIRPVSKKSKAGYLQVGVELYGGGIWHSWFDRDLSIAGRVIVKGAKGGEDGEGYVSKLVKVDRPLLRIPTLAIHLERGVNEQ
jgi:hypothetical protein